MGPQSRNDDFHQIAMIRVRIVISARNAIGPGRTGGRVLGELGENASADMANQVGAVPSRASVK